MYSIDSSIIIIICPLETLQEKINKKNDRIINLYKFVDNLEYL